ncbi:tRNA (guanine-N1)-methyltransferase [Lacinutrix sp. C3R15]|uniref:tRNA (guanine-N1)-methyltransferase n=1 Tax=Flavobacteriaceae TaxID=49546 RepID=UPI001C080DCE|nr:MULTISPECIES: tRNA (guanine-N1)-methyltransferase [Flavobacteriaceae]MBU2940650.1 tRNA (guanine-N1)-methyltransferase [Lacinutrix sp. C3R15]MDO6623968.1 tRNA (guanine-N1)-methyltransferase [Oceanihabitans sp. 1_MG-2023]
MNSFKFIIILSISLFCTTINAQTGNDKEEEKLSLNTGTINEQFEYILKKSGNFKGTNGQPYEAVKRSMFLTLQAHTIDSLKTIHKNLTETQAVVNNQAKEIATLKTSLSNTQDTLDKTNEEKDSMSLFGIAMSKSGYNVLMWSIIGALLAFLLFFIYKFKNSNAITKEANKSLAEIEEEFEEHRKIALEREQKVRRQLQDELNKQKKL